MSRPLPPGSVIGILGGGQLGRMLSVAAARLGLRTHIYDPEPDPPAAHVADRVTTAEHDDIEALRVFAASVDAITYEFENTPTAALDAIDAIRPIRPNRRALATSQDRLIEKDFLRSIGLRTAPYLRVDSEAELASALDTLGAPAILKTRKFGYDGKGQVRLRTDQEVAAAWASLDGAPAILEGFVDFDCEISVIGARRIDGGIACYDPGRNVHREGILRTTTVPAGVAPAVCAQAIDAAGRILGALDYVGVMGVEFFVVDGALQVNEIAPRVHNSGHWTQNGCVIDQFEQHIRAVASWPLGDGSRHSDVVMHNLIGDEVDDLARWARDPAAAIHLYGKADTRPGRKMGHVNVVGG